MNIRTRFLPLLLLAFLFILIGPVTTASAEVDQRIYDEAGLLSTEEKAELEALAAEHSAKHGADFLFLTTEDSRGLITKFMGDFFDDWAEEHQQEDAVVLTIDIGSRDVYLAGFGTAQRTLDNQRIDMVLDRIMPYMRSGDYGGAFGKTVETSSRYMEFRPGVNPENIFFKTWFQAAIALLVGGIVVGIMVYNSGGRVTTTSRTYIDDANTRVRHRQDRFRNKTVSRRKVQKSSGGGGGGGFGGGGTTGGGRSFSGGGRSF